MNNVFLRKPSKKIIDFLNSHYGPTTDGCWFESNANNFYLYIFLKEENLWRRNVATKGDDCNTIRYDKDLGRWVEYIAYSRKELYNDSPKNAKELCFDPFSRTPLKAGWYPDRSHVLTIGGYWSNSDESLILDKFIETDNDVCWKQSSSEDYPEIRHTWLASSSRAGKGGEWKYTVNSRVYYTLQDMPPNATEIQFDDSLGRPAYTLYWHKN